MLHKRLTEDELEIILQRLLGTVTPEQIISVIEKIREARALNVLSDLDFKELALMMEKAQTLLASQSAGIGRRTPKNGREKKGQGEADSV
jgi:hypothetical protein